jgi:hypothetical protein
MDPLLLSCVLLLFVLAVARAVLRIRVDRVPVSAKRSCSIVGTGAAEGSSTRVLTTFSVLAIAAAMLGGLLTQSAFGQASLTTLDTPYSQSFDTLPASGSATWTNNSTIPGWFHARTGTGTTIVANDGSSNAGNLYSYGTSAATDRSLGSLDSGNAAIGNMFWGMRLQNNTGATITSLDVAYTGEQWRNSAAAAQTLAFSYLVGSPTVTGSLAEFQSAGVSVAALDFTSPITGGAAGALNGNLAANRVSESSSISGLNIPNGTEVMLRWSDPDHTGADHGLSVDDLSVTPHTTVTPTPDLTVADVAANEGDAGTTSVTFAVRLSSPAGPGGVTFDVATSDGTAHDDDPAGEDDDYIAQSLTSRTIPQGSSTYSFTVAVNGDTTIEPDETFFVDVTNVTGAGVADGQGEGTVQNDDADDTPPDTAIDSGPASPSGSPDASLTFGGTDSGGAGMASLECRLDAADFSACTSPLSYSSLSDGEHTFQVRAIDGSGNVDATPASFSWSIDATPPAVTIEQASDQDELTSAGPINFTVQFSEPVTGFGGGDVTLGGTAGPTTAVVAGDGTTYSVAVSGMTADGTVTATVPASAATDAAGNGNTTSTSTDNTVTFNVDVAPPDTGITANPQALPPSPAPSSGAAPVMQLRAPGLSVFGPSGSQADCRMRTGEIRSCSVRLLAGRRILAHGRATSEAPGRRSLPVTLTLTRFGRTLLARHLGGVRTRMRARAATSDATRTAAAGTRAILAVEHFTTPPGSWVPDRAGLTVRGRSFVRGLRGKLFAVASLRCDGHDANVRANSLTSLRLSRARAAVMCDALRQLGVHARPLLAGHGDSQPIASNATGSGRAQNRRVQVTITH